jgi:hypothetical protein
MRSVGDQGAEAGRRVGERAYESGACERLGSQDLLNADHRLPRLGHPILREIVLTKCRLTLSLVQYEERILSKPFQPRPLARISRVVQVVSAMFDAVEFLRARSHFEVVDAQPEGGDVHRLEVILQEHVTNVFGQGEVHFGEAPAELPAS